MKLSILIYLITVLLPVFAVGQKLTLNGYIKSFDSKEALPYTTVGVQNSLTGTASDKQGYFELEVDHQRKSDSIRFTYIGYHSKSILIADLITSDNDTIYLKEKSSILADVIISNKRYKKKWRGNKNPSNIMFTGWGDNKFLGGERGTRVKVRKKKLVISKVSFHVAQMNYDSVLIRLHIRKFVNDLPHKHLASKDILIVVNTVGWITKDLIGDGIVIDQDFSVSVELVQIWGDCNHIDSCFTISMTLPGGNSYFRITNFSPWSKRNLRGPTIKVELLE